MIEPSSFEALARLQIQNMPPVENVLNASDAAEQVQELRVRLLAAELEVASLRQENHIFRQALDHQPTHTAIFDQHMCYLYLNPEWVEDLPVTQGDLLGKNHYEMFPHIPEDWREQHRRGLAGESLSADTDLYQRPDGQTEYLKWKLVPWYQTTGEIGGIILYTDVVTALVQAEHERTLAQKALQSSEARYRQIFEGNHAPKLLLDSADGQIIDANRSAEWFYGYSREQLCQMNIQDLQIISADYRDVERQSLLSSQGGTFRFQQRLASGDLRVVEMVTSLVELDQKNLLYTLITDISEQERTRSTLLEQQERLRVIYERAQDGIFLIDMRGYYVDANPAGCQMTGYTLEELQTLHVDDLRFQTDLDRQNRELRRHLWTQGGTVPEMRLRRKDGSELWISISIAPINVHNQSYIVGIKRDITAQRQAQRDLLIKQRAMDEAMNAIALADMDGLLTYVNPCFLRYWGYDDPAEVIGRSAQDFWVKPEAAGQILIDVVQGKMTNSELIAKRRDGSTFTAALYASVIQDQDEQPMMLVGIFLDVTEQRLAERALIESEKRYRTVVSALAEAIMFVDRNGAILSANPGAAKLFGIIPEGSSIFQESIWKIVDEAGKPLDPDDFPVAITLRTGQSMRDAVLGLVRENGRTRWLSINTEPIFENEAPQPTAVIISIRDVTQRRLAEQSQREAEMLSQQLQQERETHHFRARMFSTIVHELRTPLASISTTAEVLQRYADRFTIQDRLQRLGRIRTIIQHLNMLLDDMSYISKSQSGDLQMQLEPIELDLFCNDIITDVQLAFQVEDRISLTLRGSETIIYFDTNMLFKILTNLLSNAVKYTSPTGQVRLDVEAYPASMTIIVQDDGIGIPQEDQQRLFGLFQRGSNVGQIKGTGLGLAIVRDTIELCGGEITFSSAENEGTTFTIRLPLRLP